MTTCPMRLLMLLLIAIIPYNNPMSLQAFGLNKISNKRPRLINRDSISVKKRNVYKVYRKVSPTNPASDTVYKNNIKRLNEPLRALVSFYSAMNGTLCTGTNCELTTSLGLGKQGSDRHKSLISKYFPNDKIAQAVVKQNCYQRPSGASSFSEYYYITITTYADTIKVDYKVLYYDRGTERFNQGPDFYLYKNNRFKMLKRNIWKHVK